MLFAVRRFFAVRSPAGAYERGVIALDRRDYFRALAEFDQALVEAASNAERLQALNKRGIAHVSTGDRNRAIEAFTAALEINPRFAPAIVNVGNMLLEDNDIDDAIEHYQAALRIDERYAPAHQNLAVAYRRLGRRGDAVRELRLAARFDTPSWLLRWQRR